MVVLSGEGRQTNEGWGQFCRHEARAQPRQVERPVRVGVSASVSCTANPRRHERGEIEASVPPVYSSQISLPAVTCLSCTLPGAWLPFEWRSAWGWVLDAATGLQSLAHNA